MIGSQWRIASGMSISYLGLDYVAVKSMADVYGFDLDEINMRKIKTIESVVLKFLNKGKE